jgi:uncharacterized protein involved in exopolysaccharide biosynthesis
MATPPEQSALPAQGERFVYVVPSAPSRSEDQLDLSVVAQAIWRGKWIISGVAMLFGVVAVAYALTATQWYRAEVSLIPSEQRSTTQLPAGLSSLGGLVGGLTGISIGGGGSAEPLAVLSSRGFLTRFIEDHGLLDEIATVAGMDPAEGVDMRDAVDFFLGNALEYTEDRQTRIIVVSVEWTDPDTAAEWANLLVQRVNEQMRQRALAQADSSVGYLKVELERANLLTMQQSVGRLLESELQKAMLARVNTEFAFRIIDPAQPPNYRSRPRRTQIVAFAFVAGAFLASFAVVAYRIMSPRQDQKSA